MDLKEHVKKLLEEMRNKSMGVLVNVLSGVLYS